MAKYASLNMSVNKANDGNMTGQRYTKSPRLKNFS